MTARLYVGTYAKYNSGSIKGAWLDLESFADKEAFLEACAELHADETDPELMFQDFEGFPKSFYHESSVPDELWDWLALDDDDRELLEVYQDKVDEKGTIEDARDAFAGKDYRDKADWAAEFMDECCMLEGVPDNLKNYIDYASWARDAELGGDVTFARHDGTLWVFHNNR